MYSEDFYVMLFCDKCNHIFIVDILLYFIWLTFDVLCSSSSLHFKCNMFVIRMHDED